MRYLTVIVWLCLMSPSWSALRGQSWDSELEISIKEAANGYLSGQATGETQDEALESARIQLILQVEQEAAERLATDAKINRTLVLPCVTGKASVMSKLRGGRTLVLVYLLKSDLNTLIDGCIAADPVDPADTVTSDTGNAALSPCPPCTCNTTASEKAAMITRIKSSPGEYLFAEATGITGGQAARKAQENGELKGGVFNVMRTYEALRFDGETLQAIMYDTESLSVKQENGDYYALVYLRLAAFRCNLSQGILSGRSVCEGKEPPPALLPPDSVIPDSTGLAGTPAKPVVFDCAELPEHECAVLEEIVRAASANDLFRALNRHKMNGYLVYGMQATLTNPENSYIVVYSSEGAVQAVYGKGVSERYNLLSGKSEHYGDAYPDSKTVWFQVL